MGVRSASRRTAQRQPRVAEGETGAGVAVGVTGDETKRRRRKRRRKRRRRRTRRDQATKGQSTIVINVSGKEAV